MEQIINNYIPIFSALISVLAVIIAARTSYKQNILNAQLAKEEQKLIYEQVRLQRDSDIINWADKCIDILSEQESFLRCNDLRNLSPEREKRAKELLHILSAMIDRGRIYFPNDFIAGKGEDKPRAYRGERQRILNHLVRCYDSFMSTVGKDKDNSAEAANYILDRRRKFVSEAQLAIDPHRYLQFFEMHDLREASGEVNDKIKLKSI